MTDVLIAGLSGVLGGGGIAAAMTAWWNRLKTRAEAEQIHARVQVELVGAAQELYTDVIKQLREQIGMLEARVLAAEQRAADLADKLERVKQHNDELQAELVKMRLGANRE